MRVGRFGSESITAIAAARAAGGLARKAFSGPLGGSPTQSRLRRNGPHDVVTPHDGDAERLIAGILAGTFPMDGFFGEETAPREGGGGPTRRTWFVDPIDGTVGFAAGIPFFSVSIALAVGEKVVMGVVHDPIHGETFVAEQGCGAWLIVDGPEAVAHRRLGIRRLRATADAVVAGDPGEPDDLHAVARVDRVRQRTRVVRTLGSTALSLAYLAAGRFDGVIQVRGLQAVDIAAGGLLAIEAGARVTDAAGGSWLDVADPAHGRGIAAGSRAVHGLLVDR